MSQHKFWNGIDPLNISSPDQVPDKIVKLCSLGLDFLILTESHIIYHCIIENDNLNFKRIQNLFAIDISYHNDTVYIIDIHGRLYKSNIDLESKEELVIREEAKSCPHGFRTPSFKVTFRNVVTNNFGELFVSRDGQLWGCGSMPHIGLDNNGIKKVNFFEGRTIYSASIGDNFAAVIARKKVKKSNCDTDSENEDEEVFATNCAQCQSIIGLASPASVPSLSDTCPLGVQISKSSEDSSSTTAPQTDIHVDAHSLSEDSSPSSEDSKITTTTIPQECEIAETNTKLVTNIEEVNSVAEDEDKETLNEINDKANNIFINTDAARQFLSKQLSWVSAGEDYLVEYTEKPTRIIKENVSNLTNFVYEGVKTVGDKVATLSRHVSGSSESNDVVELLQHHNHNINSLMYNCAPSCNNEDLEISTSTVSSEKDFERVRQNENIKMLSKFGKNILATELWTWGDISHGQLGIGDNIKRVKPVVVMNLSGFGLQKVSCGKWHCSALTLDGRVFIWGYNNYHQVSLDSQDDKSGPKQFTQNSSSDRIRDVVSTNNHTLAYTHNKNIYYMGKHLDGFTDSIQNLNKKYIETNNENGSEESQLVNESKLSTIHSKNRKESTCYHWRILSSGNISYCAVDESMNCPEFQDLSIAQRYLEEMILIAQSIVKPFAKKSKTIIVNTEIYENVCALFNDILNITALNVLSMWQFAEKHINECDISLIKNLDEYLYLYKKYSIAVCNLIVIGGFTQINNSVDVPSNIYNLFSDQLPTNKKKNNKKTSEAILSLALVQPLTRLSSYKCIVQSLLRYRIKDKNIESKSNANEKLNIVISSLDTIIDEQEKKRKEAEGTRMFWETIGKPLEQYRTPERRLIRESKSRPLNYLHSSRFTTHWFILFDDLFVHMIGSTPYPYPLQTLWVEGLPNTETSQNIIQLVTPEETISVNTNTEQEKTEWIHILNSYIKTVLNKESAFKPPSIRTAKYTFSNKHPFYKDAQYMGRWLDGKTHGNGKIEWQDGKLYIGQFQLNAVCGHGKMDIPSIGTYEGQWKDNHQNGFGILKYTSGDIYEGYFKDGVPHGHGIKKQGDFTSSSATIYTGEWQNGVKHGYGVMDDIGKGEKYLGNWSDNKKNGCGLIVTLDGIYYEGLFMQDVLTGHGVMVFEDGTHYEGEFKSAGVFSGKGVLTLSSGDKIEGSLSGAWTEGVKVNATMHLNVSDPAPPANSKPNSFGKLCVAPNQKWNALFRQCYQNLGINETLLTPTGNHYTNNTNSGVENKKIWQNVAVSISKSFRGKKTKKIHQDMTLEKSDWLEVIPQFGQKTLNIESYTELKSYLHNACETSHHPLGQLVLGVMNAFNTTYGGVRVHPLLLSHAVKELKSITSRLYHIVRLLFPALPPEGNEVVLPYKCSETNEMNDTNEDSNPVEGEVVSSWSLLQAFLLPRAHPALFVLYALHNQREDAAYWRRLLKWNKHPDVTLMAFLGIDQKFWIGYNNTDPRSATYSPIKDQLFQEAVETLQQLKTTFSPIEKLLVIRSTFQKMTTAVQQELGSNYLWSMDELFPVFHFVVVRARVLQLGSELHFLEDFLEPGLQHGELGLMFTTLKACYFQILQEKMSFNS